MPKSIPRTSSPAPVLFNPFLRWKPERPELRIRLYPKTR